MHYTGLHHVYGSLRSTAGHLIKYSRMKFGSGNIYQAFTICFFTPGTEAINKLIPQLVIRVDKSSLCRNSKNVTNKRISLYVGSTLLENAFFALWEIHFTDEIVLAGSPNKKDDQSPFCPCEMDCTVYSFWVTTHELNFPQSWNRLLILKNSDVL